MTTFTEKDVQEITWSLEQQIDALVDEVSDKDQEIARLKDIVQGLSDQLLSSVPQEELEDSRDRLKVIDAAMSPFKEPAVPLLAIADRLEGHPEAALFDNFLKDYYFSLAACRKANELMEPAAELFRTQEYMNPSMTMDDIPWITKTLSGMVTKVLYDQYTAFVEANGGQNYVELGFTHEDKKIRIIICHPDGKTPYQLQKTAEYERDEARRELQKLREDHGLPWP